MNEGGPGQSRVDETETLRQRVRQVYSAAAECPEDGHPFPVGRDFALSLGYPAAVLDQLPPAAVEAFCGLSNVPLFADLSSGGTLLDLGCGAGMDTLIAARMLGGSGRVVGLDFSPAMLARARRAAAEAGCDNAIFCCGEGERLPLALGSVDLALVNGIFNLNPDRTRLFEELARVMRPGGRVYATEIILKGPLPPEVKQSEADWFA